MKPLWAYAYRMPPQPVGRLGPIRSILETEAAAARADDRTWSGRLVLEQDATHILIVSDGPTRDDPINDQLRAELERLDVPFSVTDAMAVTDGADGVGALQTREGNGHPARPPPDPEN